MAVNTLQKLHTGVVQHQQTERGGTAQPRLHQILQSSIRFANKNMEYKKTSGFECATLTETYPSCNRGQTQFYQEMNSYTTNKSLLLFTE